MMKKVHILVCIIYAFFFSQPAIGQWRLNQIAGEAGLSQNTVRSILQDKNGFIWMGTYNGINKYDGYEMQHFKYASSSEGLSSTIVVKLFEDSHGFIWAGTTNAGLNRIDPDTGEVLVYFKDPNQPNYFPEISGIFQVSESLYFINKNDGIKLFEVSKSGKLLYEEYRSMVGNFSLKARKIRKTSNGNFWLFTPDKSIKFHQIKIEAFNVGGAKLAILKTNVEENLFDKGYAVDFYEYPKNTLWVLSNNLEVLKIKLDNDLTVLSSKTIRFSEKKAITDHPKLHVTVDKTGRLWVAGNGVLFSIDTQTEKVMDFSNNDQLKKVISSQHAQSIFVDKSNILWFGTLNQGLYSIDLETHTFFNSKEFLNGRFSQKFHKNPVLSLCEDAHGNVWIGSQGNGGVALLKKDALEKSIVDIQEAQWSSDYFTKYDKQLMASKFLDVKRLLCDRNGTVWIGTKTGLSNVKYNQETGGFQLHVFDEVVDNNKQIKKQPVFALEEDELGNLWVGYWNGGLSKLIFNATSNSYKSINYNPEIGNNSSLSNNYVRDVLSDSKGNIWVGTIGGLNLLTNSASGNSKFKRFLNKPHNSNSLSNNYVLDIFESSTGDLFVGTMGGGLNKISFDTNNNPSFTRYSIKEGLPSDIVYQIKEDENGNIWMMHVREISKLNPKTGTISYYEKQDGFQVSEFKDNAMLYTSSGIMICGGVDGLTFFKPNKLSSNNYEPTVAITDFKLFNESIKPHQKKDNVEILSKGINETQNITLSHHLNSMEFVFSSMHFSNPKKNKYKYKLEGFEDKWQYTIGDNRRFASYTNIPPGDYTFKVFGTNSSGDWSSEAKEIGIHIKKPWYLRPWALSLFLISSIAIAFLLIRIRLNQIRLEGELELESALHEKSEEINKMKLQFFTNISHELRTPLTLVIGPLQQIMKGNTDADYIKKLNIIMYKNSLRLLKLINQLLDFRKVETGNLDLQVQYGDLGAFIGNIFNAFEDSATENEIKFLYINNQGIINAWFDSDKIEKIVYNLLSNSFKFTPKGKSIKIQIGLKKKEDIPYVVLKVIDFGIGIPQDELDSIFDRFYQAKKENNTIHIGSGLGLAYTKRLIELHKGTITIESELHKGTTCTVCIPIDKESYSAEQIVELLPKQHDLRFTKKEIEDHKQIQNSPQKNVPDKTHSEDTPLILIVEDNLELQNYLVSFFKEDYKVIAANNGKLGLELAQEQLPNIIISDLMMPVMDGIEMCKKIKTDINTSHIPVLILTAKSGLENEKEGLETGADEFILKPFNIEVLKLRIDNILRTKRQWVQKFKTSSNTADWKELSNKLDQDFLKKATDLVHKNIDNPDFSVQIFTEEIGISRSVLFKKIKSITGQSTSEFIRTIRLKKAISLMQTGNYLVAEIIFMVGFSDPKYFRTCFKKQYNMTPSEYLKSIKNV